MVFSFSSNVAIRSFYSLVINACDCFNISTLTLPYLHVHTLFQIYKKIIKENSCILQILLYSINIAKEEFVMNDARELFQVFARRFGFK